MRTWLAPIAISLALLAGRTHGQASELPRLGRDGLARAGVRAVISGVTVVDATGQVLSSGALTDTSRVTVSWSASGQGAVQNSLTVNGQSVPVNVSSTGGLSAQVDFSSIPDGAVLLVISASDASGTPATVQFSLVLDRTAPQIAISAPTDCAVERSSRSQTLSGTVIEPNLASLTATQVSAGAGTSLPVTVSNGTFSAPLSLANGDNLFVVTATDLLGHQSTQRVHEAFFGLNSSVPFLLESLTTDGQPVQANYRIDGILTGLPSTLATLSCQLNTVNAIGEDAVFSFQTALDPLNRYVYDVQTGTLQSIPDGCHRTLDILYPSAHPLVTAALQSVDLTGAPISGVSYFLDGSPASNPPSPSIRVPEGLAVPLALQYGVSAPKFFLAGGIHSNETVQIDLKSGAVKRLVTQGTSLIQFVFSPIALQLENRALDGTQLGWDGSSTPLVTQAIEGIQAQVVSHYNGLGSSLGLAMASGQHYSDAIHGARFFAEPTAAGVSGAEISFFYDLASVTLAARATDGSALSASYQVVGAQPAEQGQLPATLKLGLGAQGTVAVGLNGFSAMTTVEVDEDHIVSLNVGTGARSERYSFRAPGLEWVLDPVPVSLEAVSLSSGSAVAAQVGVVGFGTPQGTAPLAVSLADRTQGSIFASFQGARVTVPLQIEKGMLHAINVQTRKVTITPAANGQTAVQWQYP